MRDRAATSGHIANEEVRKAHEAWCKRNESNSRLTNTLSFAKRLKPVADAGDGWDSDPLLLGCGNGVVELDTGVCRPGLPEDRITKATACGWEPDARSDLWGNTLRQIFDDKDVIEYPQRCLGYCITGNTEQDRWFLFQGRRGREGKDTIAGAIQSAAC